MRENDKNSIDNPREVQAEVAPEINYINKPNDSVPTLNSDNEPSDSWHLESGDKINEYEHP